MVGFMRRTLDSLVGKPTLGWSWAMSVTPHQPNLLVSYNRALMWRYTEMSLSALQKYEKMVSVLVASLPIGPTPSPWQWAGRMVDGNTHQVKGRGKIRLSVQSEWVKCFPQSWQKEGLIQTFPSNSYTSTAITPSLVATESHFLLQLHVVEFQSGSEKYQDIVEHDKLRLPSKKWGYQAHSCTPTHTTPTHTKHTHTHAHSHSCMIEMFSLSQPAFIQASVLSEGVPSTWRYTGIVSVWI